MSKFLTIFPTFENIEIVKKTLPSVLEESGREGSDVIVYDTSVKQKDEKREYILQLKKEYDFFFMQSDNIALATVRNLMLKMAYEHYNPGYICALEDDHGYKKGAIPALTAAMEKYYGKEAPNKLKYGMFTTCYEHTHADIIEIEHDIGYPKILKDQDPFMIAGTNNCFRCAPTRHWINVLGDYDPDEYTISEYQTSRPRWRNYHRGYTAMYVGGGSLQYMIENQGRGMTSRGKRRWDNRYTASDPRSNYKK